MSKKKLLMISVVCILTLCGTIFAFKETLLKYVIEGALGDSFENFGSKNRPFIKNKPYSLLLVGTDQRGKEKGRSDTLFYAVVKPKEKKVLLINIPRDTYVDIPERKRKDKINHAYSFGGIELLNKTVEGFFKKPVHYYATINFKGFKMVVDRLGGIELPVKTDIVNRSKFHDKFVVKANQPLYQGIDALNYVRYREGGKGHLSRAERNCVFLKSLCRRIKTCGSPRTMLECVKDLKDNFSTDLSSSHLSAMVETVISTCPEIQFENLKGQGVMKNRVWYYDVKEEEIERIRNMIQEWLA